MWKLIGLAVLVLSACVGNASAALSSHMTVNSGEKTVVLVFWDCRQGAPPPRVDVFTPMHGTATAAVVVGNRCERAGVPQTVVVYQSDPGFKGKDAVAVIGPNGEAYMELLVQ